MPKSHRKSFKESGKLKFDNNYHEISLITNPDNKEDNKNGGENGEVESTSKKFTYYYYHKILASDKYSLGIKVADFIKIFTTSYAFPEESAKLLPKPMKIAVEMTNEVVHSFYSNYNIGGNNKNLMLFWRSSVEKYVFGKIYPTMFAIYLKRYEETDRQFVLRSSITKSTNPFRMLKHLGVNDKYIIRENFRFRNSELKYDYENNKEEEDFASNPFSWEEKSDASNSEDLSISQNERIPYHESIKSLSSISSYTSPREKLDAVIDFFSNMKSSIVDYWKGKVELTTMDDILPLVIYTVWYCNWENFASEINFLKDFVKFAGNETTESAERTLTNIEMGIQYVNTTDEFPFSEM